MRRPQVGRGPRWSPPPQPLFAPAIAARRRYLGAVVRSLRGLDRSARTGYRHSLEAINQTILAERTQTATRERRGAASRKGGCLLPVSLRGECVRWRPRDQPAKESDIAAPRPREEPVDHHQGLGPQKQRGLVSAPAWSLASGLILHRAAVMLTAARRSSRRWRWRPGRDWRGRGFRDWRVGGRRDWRVGGRRPRRVGAGRERRVGGQRPRRVGAGR